MFPLVEDGKRLGSAMVNGKTGNKPEPEALPDRKNLAGDDAQTSSAKRRVTISDARKGKAASNAQELDDELDEALRETFPASDPLSLTNISRPGARRRVKE